MALIGIDIGASSIKAGIVKKGCIRKYVKINILSKDSKKQLINKLFQIIDKLINKDIESIGIGVPGLITKKGKIIKLKNLSCLNNVELKNLLKKKYKIPIFIDNDANCFALGEKYFGKAKKYKNIVGVIIGSGAGAGVIINNKLYSGTDSGAGQIGEIKFKNRTLEDYCSDKYFLWKYNLNGLQVFNNKNKKAFDNFGENIAEELLIIIKMFSPEIIVLGGGVAKAFSLFKKTMNKKLKQNMNSKQYKQIKIVKTANKNSGILGAAVLSKEIEVEK